MIKTAVNINGIDFKNPIIAASGTFGMGLEYNELYDISVLGGVSLKGMTINAKSGNATPRIAETPMGMLNSVGLQNNGFEHFKNVELPKLREIDTVLIANIAGSCEDDYIKLTELVSDTEIDIIELNISCPNVKEGGIAFGVVPENVRKITQSVKSVSKKPVMVKLSPNVASIKDNAKAAEDGGADSISLINTLTGMAIDRNKRKPILANVIGGLSGPAIKPVALRMVYEASKAVKIPVVGMGGITCVEDVIDFMLCGATAVQVGTANITDPFACQRIVSDLNKYMEMHNITDINTVIGGLIV